MDIRMSEAIRIPYLMTEPQAARLLGIATNTLRGIRTRGEISFRLVGKRAKYTQADIDRYLGERWANDSRSEITGSQSGQDRTDGAAPGSVVSLDKHVASRLAQQTFGKRSSD